MHVFLMPRNLNQLGIRLWMGHILDIVLLTFILTSQSSFLDSIRNILSSSLQNLSLSTISDNCVLFALVYHFADFINEFYTACTYPHYPGINNVAMIDHDHLWKL